jgi:predicted TIM-barrel fold metal-dependent hydrolase
MGGQQMKPGLKSKSAEVRSRLTHPVIDSDGHTLDFWPEYLDYLKRAASPRVVERYIKLEGGTPISMRGWYGMVAEERRERRATRPWWWVLPTRRTVDLATMMIPGLLHERLDEMGIDFTVIYNGLITPHIEDEEVRRAACFALNNYHADLFRGYGDRIAPVAEIPMHTPQEAIAELNHCLRRCRGGPHHLPGHAVGELGMKAVMMASFVQRPIPAAAEKFPHAYWFDGYGVDSEYDYDPLWARCMELKVAPTFHSTSIGLRCELPYPISFSTISEPLRLGRDRVQVVADERRDAALSATEVRFSGGRRGLGVYTVRRSDGALA